MRLAAQAKMGYYPTPPSVASLILKMLKPAGKELIRVIDPCAGEGHALKAVGEYLNAETYGIELDNERGMTAKTNLDHCLITDYESTRISNQAFSLLYLNPPYDWTIKEDDLTKSERYERTFLRNTIRYLIPHGVLIYLIPLSRLENNIAHILSYRFKDVRVFRFPSEEYQTFKQAVIFGILKKKAGSDETMRQYLIEAGQGRTDIPDLETADCQYKVFVSPKIKGFLFRTNEIDPEELEQEIRAHGLKNDLLKMISPVSLAERIRPVMPLRQGHLVQLLACGMMNGIVTDRNGNNPLIVKGITKKLADTRIEVENKKEKIIETDRIEITVNAINRYGGIFVIQ